MSGDGRWNGWEKMKRKAKNKLSMGASMVKSDNELIFMTLSENHTLRSMVKLNHKFLNWICLLLDRHDLQSKGTKSHGKIGLYMEQRARLKWI